VTDIDTLLDTQDTMGLAALIANGDVTSLEVVDASIARLESRNPVLNAVVATRIEQARREAATESGSGPLAGVPFLVKDLNCDVAGLPSTKGSRLFADHIATEDCELTRRFKAAGLVILGNTNTPEFGKNASTEPLLFGPTHNPWDTRFSPCGSSGGSAAAVAGGIVPSAHANDGGGSIRIPASACGLFGLKPTRGRTPTWPIPASFAYPVGIGLAVTRTVRDTAALLDAVAGPMPGDPYPAPPAPIDGSFLAALSRSPGKLRIGFTTKSVSGNKAHPAAVAAVERTARLLAELGHIVEEASPVYEPDVPTKVLTTIMGVATAELVETRLAQLGRPLADDDLEPVDRVLHEHSLAVTAFDLFRAQQSIERVSRDVARFHATWDLWLTPTLNVPVPELGYLDITSVEAIFTRAGRFSEMTAVFNVTGQPAISVPAGLDERGLPVGVQLVGRHCSEETLLQMALQLEQVAPWPLVAPWPPAA
jgi:amidase